MGNQREARIESRTAEDRRGTGEGPRYISYDDVYGNHQDAYMVRYPSTLTGRTMKFHSQREYRAGLAAHLEPGVVDIREQYPLPLEATVRLAESLGVRHPVAPGTGSPAVIVQAMLVVHRRDGLDVFDARAVAAEDAKERKGLAADKLKIQEAYWDSQEVRWSIVPEQALTAALESNACHFLRMHDLASDPLLRGSLDGLADRLLAAIAGGSGGTVGEAMLQVRASCGCTQNAMMGAFAHLIMRGAVAIDLQQVFSTSLPCEGLAVRLPLAKVA